MGNMWNQYPWSRPVPCDCGTGKGSTTDGMTEQEVQELIETYLAKYVSNTDLDARLVNYLKGSELSNYLANYYNRQEITTMFRSTATIADITSRLGLHAELVGYGQLGHVNTVKRTPDMTQPVGIGTDGGLWTKPGEGGTSSDLNPILKTAEMTQPVGKGEDGKLWTKPENNYFPSDRVIHINSDNYVNSANFQRVVDELYQKGGGKIVFDSGTYLFDEPIYLHGCAVCIEGQGIKNTVFKATSDISAAEVKRSVWNPSTGTNEFITELYECLFVVTKTASFNEISKCTIDGSRWSEGDYYKSVLHAGQGAVFGIFFDAVDRNEIAAEGFQLKQYANDSTKRTTNIQPCKLAHIHDLFIMGCDCGLYMDTYNFGVHVNDCTFSYNATGMCTTGSDNTYSNLEIAYNAIYGALILDGNSRLNNFKVYWNNTAGVEVPDEYVDTSGTLRYPWLLFGGKTWDSLYAMQLQNRLMVNNVEIQDNLGKPLHITGNNNIITGLMIDCNGYKEGGINNPASNWCSGVFIDGGSEGNNIVMTVGNYLGVNNLYKSPIDLHPNSRNNKVVLCQTNNACVNKNPTVSGQTAAETAIKVL